MSFISNEIRFKRFSKNFRKINSHNNMFINGYCGYLISPFGSSRFWFATVYVFLVLLSPTFNNFLNKLNIGYISKICNRKSISHGNF